MGVALISHAASVHQPWSAKVYTLNSDLFPKSAVTSVIGLGGFVWAGRSPATALLAGYLVAHSGDGPVFVIMGRGRLAGFSCAHFLLGKMRRLAQ